MNDKSSARWPTVIVSALVTLVIGVLVGRGMPSNPTQQNVRITFPGGGSIEMDVSQPEIAHAAVLEQLFSEDFTRGGVLVWLANRAIFPVDDERLVAALANDLCDPIPPTPIDEKIQKARDCANMPVAQGLRALAAQRSVPFHYVGVPVRVGVQSSDEHKPADGRANVCRESDFLGRQVELTVANSGAQLVVQATGSYVCTGFSVFPEIQLNPADARRLFGSTLLEYQDAVAVVVE